MKVLSAIKNNTNALIYEDKKIFDMEEYRMRSIGNGLALEAQDPEPRDIIARINGEILLERVIEAELRAYMLQAENNILKSLLNQFEDKQASAGDKETTSHIEEGVLEMSIYSQTPFKWLFGMTFGLFTLSFILMLANAPKIGATIGFLGATLLFLSLYALWRFNNIVLIRPKAMVLGFVASFGLLLTGIIRLI